MHLRVVDRITGQTADENKIARTEDWAYKTLYYLKVSWMFDEDLIPVLADSCGRFVSVPTDRFTVVMEEDEDA